MKSYTDISQSKKLAEILPLESADMWWLYVTSQGKHIAMMYEEPDPHYLARMESYGIKDAAIRCWSLAALLDVLPLEIETHKQTDGYKTYYYVELYMKRMGKEIYLSTERHENLVDACVEMIEKLHELKML